MLELIGEVASKTVETVGEVAKEAEKVSVHAAELGKEVNEAALHELESGRTIVVTPEDVYKRQVFFFVCRDLERTHFSNCR